MSNVDALSRVPCDSMFLDESKKDPVLSTVLQQTAIGWPHVDSFLQECLKPFFKLRLQLSIDKGCLLFLSRVAIPDCLQAKVLEILHEGHAGILRMKMLARAAVWWPSIQPYPGMRGRRDLFTGSGCVSLAAPPWLDEYFSKYLDAPNSNDCGGIGEEEEEEDMETSQGGGPIILLLQPFFFAASDAATRVDLVVISGSNSGEKKGISLPN